MLAFSVLRQKRERERQRKRHREKQRQTDRERETERDICSTNHSNYYSNFRCLIAILAPPSMHIYEFYFQSWA